VVAVVMILSTLGALAAITKTDTPPSTAPAIDSSPTRRSDTSVNADAAFWVSHRLTHLRVRPRWRAAVLGVADTALIEDLSEAISELRVGKLSGNEDAIFIGGNIDENDWRKLRASINSTGVVWRIYPQQSPKGGADVAANAAAAGFELGPKVRYSADYVAEQFTLRRKTRQRAAH
jgi:hypothetical protein